MQRVRLRQDTRAALEDVGDVLAAEGLEVARVVERPRHCFGAVYFAERDDLLHVMPGVEPACGELGVIDFGAWWERKEASELALRPRAAPLGQQGARMIGIFDVAATIVGSPVTSDELVPMVDAEPIGIGLERELLRGVLRRHRVAVRLERHPEAVRGTHGVHRTDVRIAQR